MSASGPTATLDVIQLTNLKLCQSHKKDSYQLHDSLFVEVFYITRELHVESIIEWERWMNGKDGKECKIHWNLINFIKDDS